MISVAQVHFDDEKSEGSKKFYVSFLAQAKFYSLKFSKFFTEP